MSEWQSMRDAPRDRWVLLWTPHRHCAGGMTVRGRWDYRRDEWAIEVDINMRPWIDAPTHWMPFPTPPTEGGDRRCGNCARYGHAQDGRCLLSPEIGYVRSADLGCPDWLLPSFSPRPTKGVER